MKSLRVASRVAALSALPALWMVSIAPALAQVKVDAPWVRAAVPGQLATGAFMDLTSERAASIVKVESAIAGSTELHSMEMKGNMMTMRAVDRVALPAGKQVRLAPGGFHIMLMDLKQPLKNGEIIPIKLTVEYADKKQETILVPAPVRGLGTAPEAQHHHR